MVSATSLFHRSGVGHHAQSMKYFLIVLTSLSCCYSDFITLGMPCSRRVAMEKISVINKNIEGSVHRRGRKKKKVLGLLTRLPEA